MTIAPATERERSAALALLTACNLPIAGLDPRLGPLFVAHDDRGEVIGTAALEVYGNTALLRSVAVAAQQRGSGLGQRLTRAALDHARQAGIREIYLLTETAAAFFPRFGFAPTPREQVPAAVKSSVEFTTACPQSALVMKCQLEET